MEQAIRDFAKQFQYKPEIINGEKLADSYENYVICGMGGSHLATGILKTYKPGINLYVHRDYDLPPYDESFLKNSLLIASSYSGNTEEVISFLEAGHSKGYSVAVIATGGKLIDFAKENNLPYIQMPDTGIQPRSALGYSLLSMAKMVNEASCCGELESLALTLKPENFEEQGKELAGELKGKLPIIYSSNKNLAIAYNWKIKMNETGKIPAFYNLFPELNHNEMQGMDVDSNTEDIFKNFHFIFIKDSADHERIQKRMDITEKLYQEKGLAVTSLYLEGENVFEKIFNSLILADWIALNIAKSNGRNPEEVPMVENFKKQMS